MKYKLLVKRFEHEAGIVCYAFDGYDYGLARDDSWDTGEPHTAVTLDPEGKGYPFFTVPLNNLEILK